MFPVCSTARRVALTASLLLAPLAPSPMSTTEAAAASLRAPAPMPRPARAGAAAPVMIEAFTPAPRAQRDGVAQQRSTSPSAPVPTPRPRAARAPSASDTAPILTAARPSGAAARPVRAAATIPAAIRRDELSLLGIFGGTDTRRALLRKPTGATQRVRQGDRVDAWTVSAIGPESVQLRNGGRTRTLRVP